MAVWQSLSVQTAQLEDTAALNASKKTGINTCSHARNNERRKRNQRRKRKSTIISYTVLTQIPVCAGHRQRWSVHSVVLKDTVVKNASWLIGKNTSCIVSHAPPANQPHLQITGTYNSPLISNVTIYITVLKRYQQKIHQILLPA